MECGCISHLAPYTDRQIFGRHWQKATNKPFCHLCSTRVPLSEVVELGVELDWMWNLIGFDVELE
jgi:hypothetical protein